MQKKNSIAILAHPQKTPQSPASNRRFSQGKSFRAIAPSRNLSKLSIEPVPANLAIAPDRFYLTIVDGDRQWVYPLQFRVNEIRQLPAKLGHLNLTLNADGIPVSIGAIHKAVERWLDGGEV